MILSPLTLTFVGVFVLLAVGFYGLLASRNLIKLIIALQLLGKAAMLALAAAGAARNQIGLGQTLGVTVMVADTIAAVLGIALVVQIRRRTGSLDVSDLSSLRG